MRKTRIGKVLVECQSRADATKLAGHEGLRQKGVEQIIPSTRRPRVLLFDVPATADPNELRGMLFTMNGKDLGFETEESFNSACSFAFKTGPKNEASVNWVLEVSSGELRNALISRGRVYMGWRRCRVLDFVSLTRCFKCLGLGHVAAHCRAKTNTCGHCGEDGHKKDACPKKEAPAKCGLCRRRGKPPDHEVTAPDCPS